MTLAQENRTVIFKMSDKSVVSDALKSCNPDATEPTSKLPAASRDWMTRRSALLPKNSHKCYQHWLRLQSIIVSADAMRPRRHRPPAIRALPTPRAYEQAEGGGRSRWNPEQRVHEQRQKRAVSVQVNTDQQCKAGGDVQISASSSGAAGDASSRAASALSASTCSASTTAAAADSIAGAADPAEVLPKTGDDAVAGVADLSVGPTAQTARRWRDTSLATLPWRSAQKLWPFLAELPSTCQCTQSWAELSFFVRREYEAELDAQQLTLGSRLAGLDKSFRDGTHAGDGRATSGRGLLFYE
ncbi:hypothetical protein BDZ88DRAFT_442807 [Geranomyces variabilis]|nr:hypothetical protein BDZ88DRAFT_442807 [Geranomyces variabilis]